MRIAYFEDTAADEFGPIASTRPVFELLCGQFTLRERLSGVASPSQWGVFIREHLAATYREAHPDARINDVRWLNEASTLWLNGRWLPSPDTLQRLAVDHTGFGPEVGVIDGTLVYALLGPGDARIADPFSCRRLCERLLSTRAAVPAGGRLIRRPWDLVEHNGRQLADDYGLRKRFTGCGREDVENVDEVSADANSLTGAAAARQDNEQAQIAVQQPVAVLGDPDDVSVDPTASLDPFVVLDARTGPISIGRDAKVQSFTRLEGPCHIGFGTQLFRANVRGETTIGPMCRVGGEVEASILHGYVNKYHDGFLGHSYVCPWVNLGAPTTNSDLKNDYSQVSVPVGGERVPTGKTKVGCFIGDHAKTALLSPFNTGATVGVMCMVLPGGELLPKHIPAFCRIWHGALDDTVDLDGLLETARIVMERRGCRLTTAYENMLRHLFHATDAERQQAIARVRHSAADRRAA